MASIPENLRLRVKTEQEEADLAMRATRGDREAFDQLYDRYFARMAWRFRELSPETAQAAIWEALEQLFKGLCAGDAPLSERAFRIARATHEAVGTRLKDRP